MKKYAGDHSENEFSADEPEEVQISDDEWTPDSGDAQGNRRRSTRLRVTPSKKARLAEPSTSDEEEEDEDDSETEEPVAKKKGKKPIGPKGRGRGKKVQQQAAPAPKKVQQQVTTTVSSPTPAAAAAPLEKEFAAGSFLVLKNDYHSGGDDIPIWKTDGKALLQKYVPFDQDGKTLYKNTLTYSGWSINKKELYYPAPIVFKMQNRKETIVEFLRDSVKAVQETPADEEEEEEEEDEEEESPQGDESGDE